jgi:hypothetical protein
VKPAPRPDDGVARGFLQLCSDLRFHRATMLAFEEATALAEDGYWIEARPGGAPSWADNTRAARLAHKRGAVFMGWAAHGDECLGFPDEPNDRIASRLLGTLNKRAAEFPRATHIGLFAHGEEVHLLRPDRR